MRASASAVPTRLRCVARPNGKAVHFKPHMTVAPSHRQFNILRLLLGKNDRNPDCHSFETVTGTLTRPRDPARTARPPSLPMSVISKKPSILRSSFAPWTKWGEAVISKKLRYYGRANPRRKVRGHRRSTRTYACTCGSAPSARRRSSAPRVGIPAGRSPSAFRAAGCNARDRSPAGAVINCLLTFARRFCIKKHIEAPHRRFQQRQPMKTTNTTAMFFFGGWWRKSPHRPSRAS